MRDVRLLAMLVGSILLAVPTLAKEPPPVMEDLGPYLPTPCPSPVVEDRIRLITAFTLQNKPEGASIISFEATDLARSGKKEYRTLAVELYSLVTPKAEAREIRKRIMMKIRDLERDLLEYAEKVGPPKEREPLGSAPGMVRPR